MYIKYRFFVLKTLNTLYCTNRAAEVTIAAVDANIVWSEVKVPGAVMAV